MTNEVGVTGGGGGGEPMAESRVRDSYVEENSHFGNSDERRGQHQSEPELSLIKLEGFEVITQGGNYEEPTELSRTSSSEAATTSMSSSTSMVTSSSRGFSPATNPLLTTSVFSETTLSEIEEDVVTLQPFTAVEEELVEEKDGPVEKENDTEDEIEKEGAGDDSDELIGESESDYFYSIYGDEYPFDYAEYINYSDEAFDDSILSNGSPVKTFTVGQESGKGKRNMMIRIIDDM